MQFTTSYFTRHTLFNFNYFRVSNITNILPIYKVTRSISTSDFSQNIVVSSSVFFSKNTQPVVMFNTSFITQVFNPFGFILPIGVRIINLKNYCDSIAFDLSWLVSPPLLFNKSNIVFIPFSFRIIVFIFCSLIFTKFLPTIKCDSFISSK